MLERVNMNNSINNKLYFIIIGALVFLALLVVLLLSTQTPADHTKLEVSLFPADSVLTIDGKNYKNKQSINLRNGNYKATIQRDGFSTLDTDFTVSKGDKYLAFILESSSEEFVDYVTDNQQDYDDTYSKSSEQLTIALDRQNEETPILSVLPYDQGVYIIGTIIGSDPLVVEIVGSTGYRKEAINKMYELRLDPADYIIEFRDYSNPFEKEG